MNLSIVIPAYNEERRIEEALTKVCAYCASRGIEHEVIVVDDGSVDGTQRVVAARHREQPSIRLVSNPVNRGKGASVRRGMMNARYGHILFSDADLSVPIEEFDKFLPFVKDYPIIIGSRRMPDSRIVVRQPWYRAIPGKAFPLIVNAMLLRGIRDTQCGFKLFRRDVAHCLCTMQRLERFSFDAELLYLARRKGIPIKEVGVVWKNEVNSKLHPVKDSYGMFVELLKVRFADLKGLYNVSGSVVACASASSSRGANTRQATRRSARSRSRPS